MTKQHMNMNTCESPYLNIKRIQSLRVKRWGKWMNKAHYKWTWNQFKKIILPVFYESCDFLLHFGKKSEKFLKVLKLLKILFHHWNLQMIQKLLLNWNYDPDCFEILINLPCLPIPSIPYLHQHQDQKQNPLVRDESEEKRESLTQ